MDNLTHTLTGVLLARAGLGKLCPRATVLLILAANAPDIDIVAAAGGALNYLHYHRWITHSIAFLPVMALLCVLIVCAFRRSWQGFWWAWLAASIGVASHLLLDWTNAYGVRLLSPFSDRWFRLDLANIVDVWIWAALILGLVAPWIGRLVSAEIGARSGSGRGMAIFAFALVAFYDTGRYVIHEREVATLNARIYQGSAPLRVAAVPIGSSPLDWKGIVEGSHFIELYEMNAAANFDPDAGRIFFNPEDSLAIEAAKKTRTFRQFLEFCRFPIWSAVPDSETEPATKVSVRDAAYGFTAAAMVDAAGRVKREWFSFRPGN